MRSDQLTELTSAKRLTTKWWWRISKRRIPCAIHSLNPVHKNMIKITINRSWWSSTRDKQQTTDSDRILNEENQPLMSDCFMTYVPKIWREDLRSSFAISKKRERKKKEREEKRKEKQITSLFFPINRSVCVFYPLMYILFSFSCTNRLYNVSSV